MKTRCRRSRAVLSLGVVLVTLLAAESVRAQGTNPPSARDTMPSTQVDSTRPPRDSIKAPFGRGAVHARLGPTDPYEWNREEMFASGAFTLGDLLERIPELTTFRSGWILAPQHVATLGEWGQVRVYYDGVELSGLASRSPGMLDLSGIPLWTLEHVSVVRGAHETRVELKSWSVNNTTPYTRTDVSTGNESTNIFRGYYGKRFHNGAGVQVAAQQWSADNARTGGGGDALSLLARYGFAGRWASMDAYAVRTRNTRGLQQRIGGGMPVSGLEETATIAYLRAGIGKVTSGPWLQLTAATEGHRETTPHADAGRASSLGVPIDTADTNASRAQYVVAAGINSKHLGISVTQRLRPLPMADDLRTMSATIDWSTRFLSARLFAERFSKSLANARAEAAVTLSPLSFVRLMAGGGWFRGDTLVGSPNSRTVRAEAGLRLGGPWLTAGYLSRDTALLVAPIVYDTAYRNASVGETATAYLSLRGPLFAGLYIDAWGGKAKGVNVYRPEYQSRAELGIRTNLLSHFPSGNFGINAALAHEYRSQVFFPIEGGARQTTGGRSLDALLEVRILRGVVSYQVRNMLGDEHDLVPGFRMPRNLPVYGVRWDFWN